MELILIRHATTQGNLEHRFIGITDIPILPQGEALARSVSPSLPEVDHVYRSPLCRCQQTAALLWPKHTQQTVIPGLRETDFGPFEGKNHEDLKNDPLYLQWIGDSDLSKLPVGETMEECVLRLTNAIREVVADAKQHGYERVGVCTHGGSLMALMSSLGTPERKNYYDWECPNCSGFHVAVEEEPLRLRVIAPAGELEMTAHFGCLLLGILLDLLIGDPRWLPHPVRGIGRLIELLERGLRRVFPATPAGELWAGGFLVVLVTGISAGLTALILWAVRWACAPLAYALSILLTSQCLAAKSLRQESMKVYDALTEGELPEARYAVSMIVGRDTHHLDEAGVAKAAVETVAENFSDGVAAPLLFLSLGGPVLGIFYKAVNTMDSMVGYQNDRYCYFGRCAAKLDDLLNLIPARLSGVMLCLAAPLRKLSGREAWRIFRRDRKNHKSPNSAHTEAAAAGALGVQLAGPSYYFGKLVEKPTIGDNTRPIEPEDIRRVNDLVGTAYALTAALLLFPALALIFN